MTPELKVNGPAKIVPRATYRLQLHERFTLNQARALGPYLRELGVSHIYVSPLARARPHSTHGYDACDFTQLNPDLGTEDDLKELIAALRAQEMGLVLDIVPNHMGAGGPENRWWWDVLKRGPESPFATYFDIDWNSSDPRLRGKVLAPVLAERYHHVLERHELRLEARRDTWLLRYKECAFPLNARSLKAVRGHAEKLNADPTALDELIEQQFYRLTWHGNGDSELNYRRFCNIADLPGICVEKEQVFNQVFALTRKWLEDGWLDGLRVDHVDGLRDPAEFLQRLRKLAPDAWIVVEKILEPDEPLTASWPIAGTTGYDFLNRVGGLFVNLDNEKALVDIYRGFTGNTADFAELARDKKRLVLQTLFAAEVEHIAALLLDVSAKHWRDRDFTRAEISEALTELIAAFPVSRTYLHAEHGSAADADVSRIRKAIDEASRARPRLPQDLFEFLSDLLLLAHDGDAEKEFVSRFQQLTVAAAAKGVEDTAFYCFNEFVALNEVGGSPAKFGFSVDEFHQFCRQQQEHWPNAMLTTSTHDTKRSEDVRARLCLLSEIPGVWREAVGRWFEMNHRHRTDDGPDCDTEYLYYQTLVGAWPLPAERALSYMQKAAREAKQYDSEPGGKGKYDQALQKFVCGTLDDPEFRVDLEEFVQPLVRPGCINSLAMTLLKLTAPGVPDLYQGTDLWDLSLVDPDNRRPVDFPLRQELLARAAKISAAEAWKDWGSGLPKLWLIRRVLHLRAQRPELFVQDATYVGMAAQGAASAHAVAFKRGKNLIAVTPRLVIGLGDNWRDTTLELPKGKWRNQLTDETLPRETVPLSALLAKFPVALLVREEDK